MTIPELAEGLTEAQRKVLRAMSARRFKTAGTILRHAKISRWPRGVAMRGLLETGTSKWWQQSAFRLSPTGLAVRNHLFAIRANIQGDAG